MKKEVVSDVLREHYAQCVLNFQTLNTLMDQQGQTIYHMCRVELSDGRLWVVSAFHNDFAFRERYRLLSNQPLREWLQQRAALLNVLATQAYPAPRVIPSRDGTLVVADGDVWHLFVTTFVEGHVDDRSLENLRLIGAALGTLHNLKIPPDLELHASWWSAPERVRQEHDRLASVPIHRIPRPYQHIYHTISASFHYMQQSFDVMSAMIHGDCWTPNTVRTGRNAVTFIDWECAGKGLAILDLGAWLLKCQCDERGDMPEEVDAARITSVMQGYICSRPLPAAELDLLAELIRFSMVRSAVGIFVGIAQDGWTSSLEGPLARMQRGCALAEPIAHLVQAFLEKEGSRL